MQTWDCIMTMLSHKTRKHTHTHTPTHRCRMYISFSSFEWIEEKLSCVIMFILHHYRCLEKKNAKKPSSVPTIVDCLFLLQFQTLHYSFCVFFFMFFSTLLALIFFFFPFSLSCSLSVCIITKAFTQKLMP